MTTTSRMLKPPSTLIPKSVLLET